MNEFHELFKRSFDTEGSVIPVNLRHPKIVKLEELILEHFEQFAKSASSLTFLGLVTCSGLVLFLNYL